ncbi:MAG: hypothetical protein DSY50_00045 [Desulfobulbus sp.]|nr:MAG: hypothetical protein DSY50_00045 [Desulfobulbus sp.]
MLPAQAGSLTGEVIVPDKLQEVYREAVKAHEEDDYGKAVELYSQILAVHPDADLVLYNKGLALYQLERFSEAAAAFTKVTEVSDADADTWYNLGLALKGCGVLDGACHAYERALALQPDEDILFNLANCYQEYGAIDKATSCYAELLKINPDHLSANNNFAFLCHKQGKNKHAKALYSQVLALEPDHPGAAHMLAALNGTGNDTPSPEYIRNLFDQYSTDFEESLIEKLGYRVPELMFAALNGALPDKTFVSTLDLGCGTGLAGTLFRQSTQELTGVDLSSKMLAVAAEKKVYDQLETADVLQFLDSQDTLFDLFIAADLLMYMADLEPLFSTVKKAASTDALFVFSTERTIQKRWQIQPTGRFAHNPEYISVLVDQVGGRIVSFSEERIRKEGDLWLTGNIFLVQLYG